MGLENYRLDITDHAHHRFIQRIGPISKTALESYIFDQLQRQYQRKGAYLQTADDTWWRIGISDNELTFYTCYGRHSLDIPRAIKWARKHKDRIALGGIYGD